MLCVRVCVNSSVGQLITELGEQGELGKGHRGSLRGVVCVCVCLGVCVCACMHVCVRVWNAEPLAEQWLAMCS